MRATGGIWFGDTSAPSFNSTNLIDTSTGAALTTGGTWVNNSDRASKENFRAVDGKEILERLGRLSIQSWNYKVEGSAVRHVGPTAQDFFDAFGLGVDDKHIATLDSEGVALVAIQALNDIVKEKDAAIREMSARLKTLESLMLKQQASR